MVVLIVVVCSLQSQLICGARARVQPVQMDSLPPIGGQLADRYNWQGLSSVPNTLRTGSATGVRRVSFIENGCCCASWMKRAVVIS
ncbi:hypothetical protein QBC44DRAFT_330962 [Cladorrhinum sp. PSN332]|nr:hypothetical protein QBC44DRAFT_330962 [Cladorrhinum sp. PSN332]